MFAICIIIALIDFTIYPSLLSAEAGSYYVFAMLSVGCLFCEPHYERELAEGHCVTKPRSEHLLGGHLERSDHKSVHIATAGQVNVFNLKCTL